MTCGSSVEGVAYSLRVRSAIAILLRATLFLLCRNLSISGTNSPRLLDLRIKEQEPKKLMVKREKEVVEENEKEKEKEKF